MSNISIRKVNQNVDGYVNVYIGRQKKGQPENPLRNPFYMSIESDRERVCNEFEAYFNKHVVIPNDPIRNEVIRLYRMLKAGHKINLQCFCYPKRCHGNTIKAFLEKYFDLEDVLENKSFI